MATTDKCYQIHSKRLKEVIGHFVTASAQRHGLASNQTYQGNSRLIVCCSFEPGGVVRKQLYCPPLCVEGMINYLTTGWRHASPAFFLFLATFNNVTVFFVFQIFPFMICCVIIAFVACSLIFFFDNIMQFLSFYQLYCQRQRHGYNIQH